MGKQKDNAQAAAVDTTDQVQVAITGNAAHDGVEYVINTQRFVDREIAKVLCWIGVAKEVEPAAEAVPSGDEVPPPAAE